MSCDQSSAVCGRGEMRSSAEVGAFRWDVDPDCWWWSASLYRLYGYDPFSVAPTLERFLQHKDPADRARIDAVLARCQTSGGPFSCYHHIIDAHGRRKTVVAVGHGDRDPEDSHTVTVRGFLVDVTASSRQQIEEALQAALDHRAAIEQVKGALMLVHGLDADAAFRVLCGYSQVYNVKVSAIVAAVLPVFTRRESAESVSRRELDLMLWDATHQAGGTRGGR